MEGSLVGLSVNLAVALVLPLLPFVAEAAGALVAVLSELLPVVDDNFAIPLASGLTMYLLS